MVEDSKLFLICTLKSCFSTSLTYTTRVLVSAYVQHASDEHTQVENMLHLQAVLDLLIRC